MAPPAASAENAVSGRPGRVQSGTFLDAGRSTQLENLLRHLGEDSCAQRVENALMRVLQEGKNTVKTVVTYQGKEYTDEIEWNYNGERVRNADSSVRNTEHAGW